MIGFKKVAALSVLFLSFFSKVGLANAQADVQLYNEIKIAMENSQLDLAFELCQKLKNSVKKFSLASKIALKNSRPALALVNLKRVFALGSFEVRKSVFGQIKDLEKRLGVNQNQKNGLTIKFGFLKKTLDSKHGKLISEKYAKIKDDFKCLCEIHIQLLTLLFWILFLLSLIFKIYLPVKGLFLFGF